MRILLLLLPVFLLLISCQPTRRAAPPLPPGVERGQTWEEAADHGYTDDIYITPSYTTYPLKGSRNFRNAVHRAYRADVCKNEPRSATVQYVVGEDGWIINVHKISALNDACLSEIEKTMKEFEFFPAEYNDQPVKMLMAYSFSRDRL